MFINLCRTFLSLKTSLIIISGKKNVRDESDQKLEYDGSPQHVAVLIVLLLTTIFPMYLGTIKSTSKKNQVQR